jgi:hypothetical protein
VTAARIARGDLAGLDALEVDALALPLFAVQAQPQAVAGFADWRLAGRIARLIKAQRFTGAADEALLMLGLGRVGAERIFLLGLGAPRPVGAVRLDGAVKVLEEALARKVAFGASVAGEDEVGLARGFLEAVGKRRAAFDEIILLDPEGRLEGARAALAKAAAACGVTLAPAGAEPEASPEA